MSAAPHINYTREFFRPSTPLKEQLQNTSHAYLALLKYIFITSVIFFLQGKFNILPFLWLSCCCSENEKGEGPDAYSTNMWYFLQSSASTQHVFFNKIHGRFNGHNYSLVLWLMWAHFLQQCLEGEDPSQSILQVNAWKCKKYNLSFAPPSPPDWTTPLLLLIHQLIPLLDTCKTCTFITWYICIYV